MPRPRDVLLTLSVETDDLHAKGEKIAMLKHELDTIKREKSSMYALFICFTLVYVLNLFTETSWSASSLKRPKSGSRPKSMGSKC